MADCDFTLYYWPVPFRGEFVRILLDHAGASWRDADIDAVAEMMDAAPARQPAPHMGPPVLQDHRAGVSLAQTAAILDYLGRAFGIMPTDPVAAATTAKLIADANDVLYEMTRYNGAHLWTAEAWAAQLPRLRRWMAIFEAHGAAHDLSARAGFLLGTSSPGLADLVVYGLWGVMTEQLPALRPSLDDDAPRVAGLVDRVADLPAQRIRRERRRAAYGDEWCGGEIEASLRKVLA